MKKKDSIIKGIVNSVLPVILAFAFGAIIIAAIGESPLETYGVLIRKSLLTEKGFMNTLHYASPLILTGLAIAITFKANLYNMGVEGQMLLGGFFAGITGAYLNISIYKQTDLLFSCNCLWNVICADSGNFKSEM